MFETNVGPVEDEGSSVYLRPETAQGMFLTSSNSLQSSREKPPFGIAQIGKSFPQRDHARQLHLPNAEFEQMEMEFFVHRRAVWFRIASAQRIDWYLDLASTGRPPPPPARPNEAQPLLQGHHDIMFMFPSAGRSSGESPRGALDLSSHEKYSTQEGESSTGDGDRSSPT